MIYKEVDIAEIKPYPNNPRYNAEAVPEVQRSIAECGYISPIVIDENNVILAGHTRYKALRALGKEKIHVVICPGLTEEQKRKFRYLDNRTGEAAEWDFEKLLAETEKCGLAKEFFGEIKSEDVEIETEELQEVEDAAPYEAEEHATYKCPYCGAEFD